MVETLADLPSEIFQIIPRDTQKHRMGSRFENLSIERITVAVPDLTGQRLLTYFHKLVPRGNNGNAGSFRNRDSRFAYGGEQSNIGKSDTPAGVKNLVTFSCFSCPAKQS